MAKRKEDSGSGNPIGRAVTFSQDSWAELKKVHAPSRQETIQSSLVVIAMVVMFSLFLGLADFVCGWLMQNILT